ncbi:MAG: autotransporter-associated beta strand repeat-containing protein [Pirellulales bacterium]
MRRIAQRSFLLWGCVGALAVSTSATCKAQTLVPAGQTLVLQGGGGSGTILADQGTVYLQATPVPYDYVITLKRGTLIGGSSSGPSATLSTRLLLDGGGRVGDANNSNIILPMGIAGTGSLQVLNQTEIAGPIDLAGNILVRDRDSLKLSGLLRHSGDLYVLQQLDLTSPVGPQAGHLFLLGDSEVTLPRVNVLADNSFGGLTLDPRIARRGGLEDRLRLTVADGAALSVTGDINFYGGLIHGRILGQSALLKSTAATGYLENIGGSTFQNILVAEGLLHVNGSLGDSPPNFHVNPSYSSRLILSEVGDFSGDIFLNNALGSDRDAVLVTQGGTRLMGDIFLGNFGATIGGADISGRIHGGDLIKVNREPTTIRSGGHTYSGATYVSGESLILTDQGVLNSTSQVIGVARSISSVTRAELVLDNSGSAAVSDRIPDATPISLGGMKLTLIGRSGASITETLGTVRADRGFSELLAQNAAAVGSDTSLLVNDLQRTNGSVVRFNRQNDGQIRLSSAPSLENGLIGRWAIFGTNDFATYGPNGVVAYSDLHTYVSNVNTATVNDNVSSETDQLLTSDRQINALRLNGTSMLNLGTNKLQVEIGGVLYTFSSGFGDVLGGRITSGHEELAITAANRGVLRMSSSIIDNTAGPVGLTFAGSDAELSLSGVNTYSGPTIVSGGTSPASLRLTAPTALPSGNNITLNKNGQLVVDFASSNPIEIGHLKMQQDAVVRYGDSGAGAAIRPQTVAIEGGEIRANIVGNSPITKTGLGDAFLSGDNTAHTGPITIESGTLQVGYRSIGSAPVDDEHAINIGKDATLRMDVEAEISRKLILQGGRVDLTGGGVGGPNLSGPIFVSPDGGHIRGSGVITVTSAVTGTGKLTLEGPLRSGTVNFDVNLNNFAGELELAGRNLNLRGNNQNFTGNVLVTAHRANFDSFAAGSGRVTVAPSGSVTFRETFNTNMLVEGGTLLFTGTTHRLNGVTEIAGDVRVEVPHPNNVAGIVTFAGPMILQDGANLKVTPLLSGSWPSDLPRRGRVFIQGDVFVVGETTITAYDSGVQITGTIVPSTASATLNFVGKNLVQVAGSLQSQAGRTLALRFNGAKVTVPVLNGKALRGNGTFDSNFSLFPGASLAPGSSVGALSIDGNLTFFSGSRYDWEISDALGSPGATLGWDMLTVTGVLAGGSAQLQMLSLNGLGQAGPVERFDPGQRYEWLIAAGPGLSGFNPASLTIASTAFRAANQVPASGSFFLDKRADQLFLIYQVPEAGTWLLVVQSLVFLFVRRRSRRVSWSA